MAEKPPPGRMFRGAADRERHEREQKRAALTEEQRQHVHRQEAEDKKAHEKMEEELEQRKHDDIEKQKTLIDREQPVLILTPHGSTTRKRTEEEIQTLAEEKTDKHHIAELAALKKRQEENLNAMLNNYAPEKKHELDKEREATRDLATQKRQDRQATRLEPEPAKDREAGDRDKHSKSRNDEDLRKRVDENIRKAKARAERAHDHDHERE